MLATIYTVQDAMSNKFIAKNFLRQYWLMVEMMPSNLVKFRKMLISLLHVL